MITKKTTRHPFLTDGGDKTSSCVPLVQQHGSISIEYALLSALIALVILGAVTTTGTAVFDMWTNISSLIAAAIG